MNIIHYFLEAVNAKPNTVAIIENAKQVTYAQFNLSIQKTAAYFKSKGIKKGDRVMVFVPVSTDLYRVVLALFQIGAIAVFMDEWAGRKRLRDCCRHAQCKGFIAPFYLRLAGLFIKEIRSIPVKLKAAEQATMAYTEVEKMELNDSALVTFTTGSTSIPKAADRTHGFLQAQFNALQKYVPVKEQISLTTLPIVMLLNLGLGKTNVIPAKKMRKPTLFEAGKLITMLQKNKVGSVTASPSFLLKLALNIKQNNSTNLLVNSYVTGGAALYPQEALLLKQVLPKADMVILYGSTEAEPIAACNLNEYLNYHENNPHFNGIYIGTPVPEIKIQVIKYVDDCISVQTTEEWRNKALPLANAGEICVSGHHVLKHYLFDQAAVLRNKIKVDDQIWHRTGDTGMLMETGELLLLGRCKWSFVLKNQALYTYIMEHLLKQFEGVVEAAFFLKTKCYIILEVKKNFNELLYRAYLQSVIPVIATAKINYINKIPKDPRHGSKIDYDKLYTMLK
ncbi:MAG: AMP-binding protein [Bacteroidia bacterium]|nr:AMP-binding protein [Bacteroidia bacterium]